MVETSLLARAQRLYTTSHIQGHFLLRSGRTSTAYVDKYLSEADPQLLREIAEAMRPHIPTGVDALAGLERGGVPMATVLSPCRGAISLLC